ncbi:hypothetical protein [Chryseobacterium sp. 2987]|uniref:hypothetical protein n=1 Tax=Chryseobacterium sp. 2987 TaxID=2817767 RepID=UPI002861EAE2|nr:hypothetical protein [Chryseobacterium sp. 2987]MDR6921931.1 hypothetical protein [Chryseobacterium sp. 2987]
MPLVRKSEQINIDYFLQESYGKLYTDYIPTAISSRRFQVIKISNDKSSIKLIDRTQLDLLSLINGKLTTYHKIEYFEITGTYSKNERSGNLTYLFEFIIYELGYNILSDKKHSTPGSKEFWQAQIRRKNFDIYRINIKTNFKRKAKDYNENEIWGEYIRSPFTSYIETLEEIIDTEAILHEDLNNETLPDLEIEQLDSETINKLESEFGIEKKNEKLNMEDIRLIAQKYVS